MGHNLGGHLRPSGNTDIYTMIRNSSKTPVMKEQQNNFKARATTTGGTALKGRNVGKAEKHSSTEG